MKADEQRQDTEERIKAGDDECGVRGTAHAKEGENTCIVARGAPDGRAGALQRSSSSRDPGVGLI